MESKKKKRRKWSEEPRDRAGIKVQSYKRMDLRTWGGGRVS